MIYRSRRVTKSGSENLMTKLIFNCTMKTYLVKALDRFLYGESTGKCLKGVEVS